MGVQSTDAKLLIFNTFLVPLRVVGLFEKVLAKNSEFRYNTCIEDEKGTENAESW